MEPRRVSPPPFHLLLNLSLDGEPAMDPRATSISIPSELAVSDDVKQINSFFKRQRSVIEWIAGGEVSAKAMIVLSTSTASSIVAAICYAWFLENWEKMESAVVVPVVNMWRGKMWKNKQDAWLFPHLGIHASELLFTMSLLCSFWIIKTSIDYKAYNSLSTSFSDSG